MNTLTLLIITALSAPLVLLAIWACIAFDDTMSGRK